MMPGRKKKRLDPPLADRREIIVGKKQECTGL